MNKDVGGIEEEMEMKHLFRAAVAMAAAVSVGASAVAAPCTPIAPKDMEGHIELAPGDSAASVAANYFKQNGCDWGDLEQLNGFDAVVFDMEGLGGTTGNMTAAMGLSTFVVNVEGEFLDDACGPIAGSEILQTANGEAYSLEVPMEAKWLLVAPSTTSPSRDVTLKFHSDGKVCKKKKKKRH